MTKEEATKSKDDLVPTKQKPDVVVEKHVKMNDGKIAAKKVTMQKSKNSSET